MELKNNKSAWAALATLGVTVVAAAATAIVKVNKERRKRREEAEADGQGRLTAEQKMVYNEAVGAFIHLNDRLYALREQRDAVRPLAERLALMSDKPAKLADDAGEPLRQLSADIEHFLLTQVPFINASLGTICHDGTTYADYVRAPFGQQFDPEYDEEDEPTGATAGSTVSYVLKLGFFFPDASQKAHPEKAIVVV